MPCSINFSVTLQTEISTVTSDFLKQMIILKSFNVVLFGISAHLHHMIEKVTQHKEEVSDAFKQSCKLLLTL